QKPDAHLEPEILGGQGSHRANVNGVQRIIIVENFPRIRRERVMAAAIDDSKRVISDNILREPDATRAKDATFIIQNDSRPKLDPFWFVALGFDEAALGFSIIHGIFLQLAFARLVANRTIQRMIDEQKLKHALAHLLYAGAVRVN